MRYEHTQRAPLFLLLLAVAVASVVAAALVDDAWVQAMLYGVGGLTALLALCFAQLTVRDQGDRLLIAFGPLPLFRRSLRYDNIESVERSRTTLIDGWGIHLSPRGGWTWNLWGYDCVRVETQRGSDLNIGTDDPDGLEQFLQKAQDDSPQARRH